MEKTNGAEITDNWKIHFTRVPASPVKSSDATKSTLRHSRLSVSLDVETALNVRDLAFRERTSDSAVVEAALRQFFDSGSHLNLHAILERLGIAPRRRSPQTGDPA